MNRSWTLRGPTAVCVVDEVCPKVVELMFTVNPRSLLCPPTRELVVLKRSRNSASTPTLLELVLKRWATARSTYHNPGPYSQTRTPCSPVVVGDKSYCGFARPSGPISL